MFWILSHTHLNSFLVYRFVLWFCRFRLDRLKIYYRLFIYETTKSSEQQQKLITRQNANLAPETNSRTETVPNVAR